MNTNSTDTTPTAPADSSDNNTAEITTVTSDTTTQTQTKENKMNANSTDTTPTAPADSSDNNTDLSEEGKSKKVDATSMLAQKSLTLWQDTDLLANTMASTVKTLFKAVDKSKKATLIDKITLGAYLLKTKLVHRNKFYDIIDSTIMSHMQVGRYIKLILLNEKDYAEGMCVKSNDKKTIDSKLALLVEDTRVTSLTLDSIQKFVDPTMTRIRKLKMLKTEEDFRLYESY